MRIAIDGIACQNSSVCVRFGTRLA